MKHMRDLIKLMEGVMAVPGVGSPGGSESDMQTAGTVGRNQAYAAFDASQGQATEESVGNDVEVYRARLKALNPRAPNYGSEYDRLLKDMPDAHNAHVKDQNARMWAGNNWQQDDKSGRSAVDEQAPHVDTCRMEQDGVIRDQCAMEGIMDEDRQYDVDFISSSIRKNYDLATSEDELRRMVAGETGYGQNPDFDNMFHSSLDHFLNGDDTSFDHMGDDDYTDQSMRAGEMGMEEDLNNGYDTEQYATGSDFFPNGADSPVVRAVGPSGARQGDNPEQKYMQVAEVHKELVYGYRKYLKESSK